MKTETESRAAFEAFIQKEWGSPDRVIDFRRDEYGDYTGDTRNRYTFGVFAELQGLWMAWESSRLAGSTITQGQYADTVNPLQRADNG